jgi:hypothetical protein
VNFLAVDICFEEIILALESVINIPSALSNQKKSSVASVVSGLSPGNYDVVVNEAKEQTI